MICMASTIVVGLCSFLIAASPSTTPDRPDIVLIVADDLGWGDVSFLDAADIQTPAIDSLAGSGAILTDFHAGAPVCTPSRYAMFTGHHSWRSRGGLGGVLMMFDPSHRARGFKEDERTFAESLEKLGYDTMLAGKWHLGHGGAEVGPLANGFDGFVGCRGGCIDYFTHSYATVPDWWRDDEPVVEEGEATDLIADAAAEFIQEHGKDGDDDDPFLLVVSFTAPSLRQVVSGASVVRSRNAGHSKGRRSSERCRWRAKAARQHASVDGRRSGGGRGADRGGRWPERDVGGDGIGEDRPDRPASSLCGDDEGVG